LQNPRSRGFFVQADLRFVVRAVGMEPFMELSRTRSAPVEQQVASNRTIVVPLEGPADIGHAASSSPEDRHFE
jgi:hypothetical protein